LTFSKHPNNRQEGIFYCLPCKIRVMSMIPLARSHDEYCYFVSEQINREYSSSKSFLQDFFTDHIFWITSVNLSKTATLMEHRYSSKKTGKRPLDPADLLRSLLLMVKLRITSIDLWVQQLRTMPIYAILSGFKPNATPGVGTFYDFFKRLWLAPSPHLTRRCKRKLHKPRKKGRKNEKMAPRNPNITEKLVRRALRQKQVHYAPRAHDLLQELFQSQFVQPSADKGLLGDTKALSVIGDGTPVQTGGRAYGKFLCDCRIRGDWKCSCKRQFSDPDADYGWDSYREKYYYGRTLYMITAADSFYNLPLYPRLFRASQHDSVSWICAYRELQHWYADWNLGEAILDSAHDALPIYTLLEHDNVSSIIDLNLRRSGHVVYNEMKIGSDGVPVCTLGRKMLNWGKCSRRHRTKWRCPAVIGGWECSQPCSPSTYGRTFYTSTSDNPRLFPRIRRDSKEWRNRYKLRTGVERCIKRQKVDYKLEASRGRSSRHFSTRIYFIAMCQHADAWLTEAKKNKLSTVNQWLNSLTS
jgi:Transposase DDE domain